MLLDQSGIHTMASSTNGLRDKRLHNPTKIFSPTAASMPTITHYLIYIAETVSYSIVGRASVKRIQGTTATLVLNKTTFVGEIVLSDNGCILWRKIEKSSSFLVGNFSDCQKELNKRQRLSQSDGGKLGSCCDIWLAECIVFLVETSDENEVSEEGDIDDHQSEALDGAQNQGEYEWLVERVSRCDLSVVQRSKVLVLDESDNDDVPDPTTTRKRKTPSHHSSTNNGRPSKRARQTEADQSMWCYRFLRCLNEEHLNMFWKEFRSETGESEDQWLTISLCRWSRINEWKQWQFLLKHKRSTISWKGYNEHALWCTFISVLVFKFRRLPEIDWK